ncbi:MAG: recombinase family protein [Eubacterium sp.]|nr:recombinase family protein [Eubacterium sp.]
MKNELENSKEWRIIAYVRLSDEDHGKAEGEKSASVENQIKQLELYIKNMKALGENIAKHKVIYDDGETGTDTKRTGFNEVIELLKEKKYNCLLISDLSRGFRNISDQTYYLEEYFPLHDIRFISTTLQYVDSYLLPQSAMNLSVKIQGITNEQFAYDTSIKIRSKFDLKRKLGEFIGAFAPFGYDKSPDNNDILIIDPAAAEIVKKIFLWYSDDLMSLGAIVRKLNALEIPNPTKYKNRNGIKLKNPMGNDGLWSSSSVRRILTNEVYLGKMVQGREEVINYKVHKSRKRPKENWYIVDGTHEPIIDNETFQRAQRVLGQNVRAGTLGNIYPLGGILKCGECKKAMSRKSSKGNVYYSCRTYNEKGKQFCQSHSIREDVLFSAVLEAVNFQILQLDDIQLLLQRISDAPRKSTDIDDFEEKIALSKKELENEIAVCDRLYYDLIKGSISEEQFKRIRDICEKRQNELMRLIKSLSNEITNNVKTASDMPAYFESFKKNKRASELKRSLALDLIESVYVYNDKSVEINFRFADQYVLFKHQRMDEHERDYKI